MPGDDADEEGFSEDDKDVVVICGTVFMMVDVREELGFDEPRVSKAAGLSVLLAHALCVGRRGQCHVSARLKVYPLRPCCYRL